MNGVNFSTLHVPESERRKGHFIQTHSGKLFWITDPDPTCFDLADIAHALSHLCRFCGHTKHFYSVAQHTVLGSLALDHDKQLALEFLHHDDTEAYLADMPTPLKKSFGMEAYSVFETQLQVLIWKWLGLEPDHITRTLDMDRIMLHTEMNNLKKGITLVRVGYPISFLNYKIKPWGPKWAKAMYLLRHAQLTNKIPRWVSKLLSWTVLKPIPLSLYVKVIPEVDEN